MDRPTSESEHSDGDRLFDELTGLPNRQHLQSEIERIADENPQTVVTAALVSFVGLAKVTSRHGRNVANEVLLEATRRWQQSLLSDDAIGRVGASHFAAFHRGGDPAINSDLGYRLRSPLDLAFVTSIGSLRPAYSLDMVTALPGQAWQRITATLR